MNNDMRLAAAKKLVTALELNEQATVEQLLDELGLLQKTQLFQEIGKLTRQLHNVLAMSVIDPKIAELATESMPDARERLKHVITLTDQATHQTLVVVERLLPLAERCKTHAQMLVDSLQGDTQALSAVSGTAHPELRQAVQALIADTNTIYLGLQDILLAQGFQDITGQIIYKVIDFVQELEEGMVSLIRGSGGKSKPLNGPNVPGVDDKAGGVAGDQDDVDDLLSSLGF